MSLGRSGSLASLREHNRLQVLETVRARGAVSRPEIARRTGLSRSTVSTLVSDLQAGGLLVERTDGSGPVAGRGRPAGLLSLDPSGGAVVGIYLDHPGVQVAVADLGYRILAEEHHPLDIDLDAEEGLAVAADAVDRVLAAADVERDRVLGAGLAFAGPIDRRTGLLGSSAILPGWIGINPARALGERLGLPVAVDNDANLGALAEHVLGAGVGADDMLYLRLSSGIGAGLVLDGHLYRGAGGTAGEIGHTVVDDQGALCRCGLRGCLETLAGAEVLVGLLRGTYGDDLTVERMIALAVEGDRGAERVIADAGRVIGSVLAALCNQFNPERVVVGGNLVAAGDVLLEPVRQAVVRSAIPAAADVLRIVPAHLGDRAEILGALVLAVGSSDRALSGRAREAVGR